MEYSAGVLTSTSVGAADAVHFTGPSFLFCLSGTEINEGSGDQNEAKQQKAQVKLGPNCRK